ncbi:uncharacterized protein B0J16DRAFT_418600 [Fusarium flagelliforme]|uniref:uncharacterized protein n=1 Tax=Fusarium flagelliforme TaxID=2675880 RepID=UPI001E8DC17A|nr:uncharacterized protein B0J16DRAFT_418600 [Fusarium flagelliforme]KAH7173284.1 hypothetical protein B0J16DRAFT_418600 [Fusarium flagelliforme]
MDPITAFQVAGTVITFVEFSRRLLNDAREVYISPSGHTSQVARLGDISDDLTSVGDHITATLKEGPASTYTKSDEALAKICERCIKMKIELQEALEGLKARGDTKFDFAVSTIATALKSMWSQSKLDDLNRRLKEAKSEMTMAVLMSLWEQEMVHGRSRQESLDSVLASVRKSGEKLDLLKQDLIEISSHLGSNGARRRSRLFRELWKADWRPEKDVAVISETSPSDEIMPFIRQNIIDSLWFDSVESRDRAIAKTYKSTYKWILDPNGSTGFIDWMQGQTLLFWITGKPGSGKSTLMKYLVHHESTMQHLQKWAGELPLLLCHFYFWDATTEELQHSQEGLIKSLLWQCLKKRPDLVQKAAPRRWAAYNALRGWEGPVPDWNWEEMQETFHNLASLNNSSFRMVIFLDGLDEFDGGPSTLIQWIKDIVTQFNVKVCVASRPWNAFSDAFDQYPSLTMQALTAPDIRIYIDGHFKTSHAFRDWQILSPDGTEALRKSLIDKAEGVFLWVYIVVKQLMYALERGKNLEDLGLIIDSLPTEIMELYTKIYKSTDPDDSKKAAIYFSCLKAAIHEQMCSELWYIEENTTVDPDDGPAWMSMKRTIKRRLSSSTRGMIELSGKKDSIGDAYIVFYHRSVKEWLSLPETAPLITAHLPESFDARLLLMKGCRSKLLRLNQINKDSSHAIDFFWNQVYVILWYASQVAETPTITPILIREMETARASFDYVSEVLYDGGAHVVIEVRENTAKFHPSMLHRVKMILSSHTKNQGRVQHSGNDTVKVDAYDNSHWCLNQGRFRSSAQSCFTVLAAQFAVYPYVMAQVTESPDLLDEKEDRVSLLHAAMVGPHPYQQVLPVPQIHYRQRLRLLKTLLDSGAPTKGRIHLPNGRFGDRDIYHMDAIDQLGQELVERIGPRDYWYEVKRLLREKSRGARFRQTRRYLKALSEPKLARG